VDNAVEKGLKQLRRSPLRSANVDLIKKASKFGIDNIFNCLRDISRAACKLMLASGECVVVAVECRYATVEDV